MSPEHVAAMNAALAGSRSVSDACRAVGRSGRVHYRLTGGPDGEVHWTIEVTPSGLSFGLERPDDADAVIERDYVSMVRAARATREGRVDVSDPPAITGDVALLSAVAPVLALARSVATIDVEFPDV